MPVCLNTRATGAGLVEVLIALLVFSLGVLGLAGMQLAAKRNTFEATQRSVATDLAGDMIARLRLNPGEMAAYSLADLAGAEPDNGSSCTAEPCTPAAMAKRDIASWRSVLAGQDELRHSRGGVMATGGLLHPRVCFSSTGGAVTVAIAWRGIDALDNPTGSDCGESELRYGPDNRYRRLLLMTTYLGGA